MPLRGYLHGIFVAGLACAASVMALAGDFEDGMRAVKKNDHRIGLKLLEQAAKGGHSIAAYNLGVLYSNGRSVTADLSKAKDWFQSSAKAGNSNAQFSLGVLLSFNRKPPNNPLEGFKWLEKAYKNGHLKAGYYVAKSYALGTGVAKNTKTSLSLLRETSKRGQPDAMNEMGMLYSKGRGVPKDINKANDYWQRGSEQENIQALYNLGYSYELGRGLQKDYSKAAEHYSRSANQGHYWPMYRLGRLLEHGLGLPKNDGLAAKWYLRSAKEQYPPALYAIARLTEAGRGVPLNIKQANAYYINAAGLGHKKAKAKLLELAKLDHKRKQTAPPSSFPKPGPEISYKGKRLVGSSYPGVDNKAFFETVKFAINMTEKLPKDVRKNIEFLKDIIYDPPSPHRKKKDITTNIVGVYTVTDMQNPPGPIIIYQDMKWSAPVTVAMSLLGNSIHAKRHVERIRLEQQLRTMEQQAIPDANKLQRLKKRYDDLVAGLEKTNLKTVARLECEPMRATFEAMKIWGLDPVRRDRLSIRISARNCWDR